MISLLPPSPSPTGLSSPFEACSEQITEVLEDPPQADYELLQALLDQLHELVLVCQPEGPSHNDDTKIEDPTPASPDSEEATLLECIRTLEEDTSSSDSNEPSNLPDPMDYL